LATSISKYERLRGQLVGIRAAAKNVGRIGTTSMLVSGGGILGGYLYARHPIIPNTTFPSAAAIGSGLVVGGLSGIFGNEYSDQIAAVGSGLLAVVFAKEAEKYFEAE
jgi:hypothetical protein